MSNQKVKVDSGFNHNRNVGTEDKYWLKLNQTVTNRAE